MPLPWVFDWSMLESIERRGVRPPVRAVPQLDAARTSTCAGSPETSLLNVLQEAAPSGARDADPAFWQLRLDALRMANRPDQFDEAAIDYCMTYEVSPPSWEPTRCVVRISGSGANTTVPPLSLVSDASTSFHESQLSDEPGIVQVHDRRPVRPAGGRHRADRSPRWTPSSARRRSSTCRCARLIRVDFIAAGDLLNWVLARRGENRTVTFLDAQRMVALFFGAMGINEHATVKVRTV